MEGGREGERERGEGGGEGRERREGEVGREDGNKRGTKRRTKTQYIKTENATMYGSFIRDIVALFVTNSALAIMLFTGEYLMNTNLARLLSQPIQNRKEVREEEKKRRDPKNEMMTNLFEIGCQ